MSISLEESYAACRALNRKFGSTYYWSTSLLPRDKQPYVHALYGFCRYADDIVDVDAGSAFARERALTEFGEKFFVDLDRGDSDDPVLKAVVDTTKKLNIDRECFERFLKSMHMDFYKTGYADFEELMEYMDGSAAVIGEMMLPVLEPTSPKAFDAARNLGVAFQLTNFLRDVNEDLDRGRIYIPQNTLMFYGVDATVRKATPEWKAAIKFEVERTRGIYAEAEEGLDYLTGKPKRCVTAARKLYGGILDQIETKDYDVFSGRVRVPHWRKLAAAARIIA